MRILLTRPATDGDGGAARLAARGHVVTPAPLLDIVRTDLPPPQDETDALLATSAHPFRLGGKPLATFHDRPLHVVGARTVEAARHAGFTRIETLSPDADALARRLISAHPRATRFLYLAGRDRRPHLETMLREAGHATIPWVVYEARAVQVLPTAARDALAGATLDAVLHFSPRSAEIFVALAIAAGFGAMLPGLRHVAISEGAAQPLRAHGLHPAVAPTPDLDGMIAALA